MDSGGPGLVKMRAKLKKKNRGGKTKKIKKLRGKILIFFFGENFGAWEPGPPSLHVGPPWLWMKIVWLLGKCTK
jgi:hypothetical protein